MLLGPEEVFLSICGFGETAAHLVKCEVLRTSSYLEIIGFNSKLIISLQNLSIKSLRAREGIKCENDINVTLTITLILIPVFHPHVT